VDPDTHTHTHTKINRTKIKLTIVQVTNMEQVVSLEPATHQENFWMDF